MKALRLLLLAAVACQPACTTAGRIFGLALAEDTTRIAGALTNQEKNADELADKIALARKALEAHESKLSASSTLMQQLEDAQKAQPGAAVTTGTGILVALLADYMQGLRRDNNHKDRERALEERLHARRRRRDDEFDDFQDETPPRARRRGSRPRAAA